LVRSSENNCFLFKQTKNSNVANSSMT